MPLAAAGGGAACVVVVGGGGGAGAFVVVGCGDGFGAGLATFAACADAVWDAGLAAVAPLLLPPQPATTSATIGTTAAPAMNWMDLVRIMMLLLVAFGWCVRPAGCDARGGRRTRRRSSRSPCVTDWAGSPQPPRARVGRGRRGRAPAGREKKQRRRSPATHWAAGPVSAAVESSYRA